MNIFSLAKDRCAEPVPGFSIFQISTADPPKIDGVGSGNHLRSSDYIYA